MDAPLEVKLTESYVKSDEVSSEYKTVIECLKHHAETVPDKESVVFVSTDSSREAVTWQQLYETSKEYARAFLALGIAKDEIVALSLCNCPEWLYATFGVMLIGAKSANVTFNFQDGSDVISVVEKLEKCAMLIMDFGIEGANWKIAKTFVDHVDKETGKVRSAKMPYLRYLIGSEPGGDVNMPELMHLNEFKALGVGYDAPFPDVHESDIAFLFNSSGSTGSPKLVAHTHRSIISVNIGGGAFPYDFAFYNDRPFAWIGGCPLNVVSGMKRVTMSGYSTPPEDYMAFVSKMVAAEGCIMLGLLPSQIPEFSRRFSELFGEAQLLVSTGTQPIRQSLLAEYAVPTCAYVVAYAGTEFGIATTTMVVDVNSYEDFMSGTLFKGPGLELKVVYDNGQTVPVNTRGEIYLRSTGLMKGYLNDTERTNNVITSDGWYKTDDIGRLSENGKLYVEGRKSNVIISDGINVYPEILEGILELCPGVEACNVVPVPDVKYHQVICACVVRAPGSDVDEDKLRKYCDDYHSNKSGTMASKLPTFYMFLESFPITFTGKVDRRELTKMAADKCVKK